MLDLSGYYTAANSNQSHGEMSRLTQTNNDVRDSRVQNVRISSIHTVTNNIHPHPSTTERKPSTGCLFPSYRQLCYNHNKSQHGDRQIAQPGLDTSIMPCQVEEIKWGCGHQKRRVVRTCNVCTFEGRRNCAPRVIGSLQIQDPCPMLCGGNPYGGIGPAGPDCGPSGF
ncbi:hypothetical protein K402DRAFT_394308 [Aulographum hederae CBS 113979]|uniref:Uncharacterized protein n=1 Tax=Aulographum hederae CBS 113979 TaxID=1176131 RepID=A0A6G1GZ33_9PEZI|nr:hypothetical protein K402DRAFT_394308 [Aulographum hederae CBS 113979]